MTTRIRVAAGTVALAAALGLSACGASKPDRASLVAKIKTESSAVTDAEAGCLADVLLRYGRASDLDGYVKGSEKLDDIKGPADKITKANTEEAACFPSSTPTPTPTPTPSPTTTP